MNEWCSNPRVTRDVADEVRGVERVIVILLVFAYFVLGYLWAGSDHARATAGYAVPWLDGRIPLVPAFILFYMLGYLFVLLPAIVLRQRRDFEAGVVVLVAMLSLAFLLFQSFPIYMFKEYATGTDFLSGLTRYQQRADLSVNNLPSLHVTLNVYAWALLCFRARELALWVLPLLVGIVLSTLLVKQHLVVDVLGGLLLAALGFCTWMWLRQSGGVRVMYALALAWVAGVLLTGMLSVQGGMRLAVDSLAKIAGQ